MWSIALEFDCIVGSTKIANSSRVQVPVEDPQICGPSNELTRLLLARDSQRAKGSQVFWLAREQPERPVRFGQRGSGQVLILASMHAALLFAKHCEPDH